MLLQGRGNHQCDPKALPAPPGCSCLSHCSPWITSSIHSCQLTSSCKAYAYTVIPVPDWNILPTQPHLANSYQCFRSQYKCHCFRKLPVPPGLGQTLSYRLLKHHHIYFIAPATCAMSHFAWLLEWHLSPSWTRGSMSTGATCVFVHHWNPTPVMVSITKWTR